MKIDKLKAFLDSHEGAWAAAVALQNAIPKRLRYHSEYFEVRRLCELSESGEESQGHLDSVLKSELAQILRIALENVPYYRETVRIPAREVVTENAVEALRDFPYLEKGTVTDNPAAFQNERPPGRTLVRAVSGGSTGEGIELLRSKRGHDIEQAFFDHEWGKLGYRPLKSRVVRMGADARKRQDEDPYTRRGDRLLISPWHLDEQWLDHIYATIVSFRPDFFHSYPSCLLEVARYIIDTRKPRMRCRGLFIASEPITPLEIAVLRKAFEAPIVIHYGLCERTNLAFSRFGGDGDEFYYRLNDVYGFSENRRDEDGYDEIVGTSYWYYTMPLIRYRTQDYGTIKNGVIRSLTGRTQDFLIDRNHRKVPALGLRVHDFPWKQVRAYQFVQTEPGKITVRILPRERLEDGIQSLLCAQHNNAWGELFDFSVEIVDQIPRGPSGKRPRVINGRPPLEGGETGPEGEVRA